MPDYLISLQPQPETTKLSPLEEQAFLRWIESNKDAPGMAGWQEPDSHYDYRGFFHDKEALGQWHPGDHGPDTYKQHGHPTFSHESKYSRGLQDGGQWLPDTDVLMDPPKPSHESPEDMLKAILKFSRKPR